MTCTRAPSRLIFVGIDAHDFAVDPDAQITLLLEKVEEIARLRLRRNRNPERDAVTPSLCLRRALRREDDVRSGDRRLRGSPARNLAAAARTKRARDARPEQFQVIVDLRHRADGRARALDRIRLLDRDRRRDSANFVDARLVHAVEELPHVGTERFDVAALAFRVDRVEGERRFAAPARAGDDGQFAQRQIEIDALEIVLTRPSNLDATALSWRGEEFFVGFRRNHRRLSGMPNRFANNSALFREFFCKFVVLRNQLARQIFAERLEKFRLRFEFLLPLVGLDREKFAHRFSRDVESRRDRDPRGEE